MGEGKEGWREFGAELQSGCRAMTVCAFSKGKIGECVSAYFGKGTWDGALQGPVPPVSSGVSAIARKQLEVSIPIRQAPQVQQHKHHTLAIR